MKINSRILLMLCFIGSSVIATSQTEPNTFSYEDVSDNDNLEEYNFFYSDSANGEFTYGDYEPKGLIYLADGSYVIGTELSVSFPSQYNSSSTYDSTYFAKSKIYRQKSHTSSGTVFKLNSEFEKEWETIFKEQRVAQILKTTDNRILVVGEDVSMKFVWIAELNQNGNILWEKHFNYKNQVTIGDAIIDDNNEIYLLLEASRTIPIHTTKRYSKRRIHFFKDSEINSHLAVLKVSSEGKKIWLTPLDKRKEYEKFGYNLVTNNQSLFASYTYSGFEGTNHIKGKKVIEISKSGKEIKTQEIPEQDILLYKNGLITITSYSKGPLLLYNEGELIDSILIKSADKDVRVEKVIKKNNEYVVLGSNYDNNRDYLLINLSTDVKFAGYWTYPRDEYNDIRGAISLDNGDIIILGKCYSSDKEGATKSLTSYINLIRIKNGI